MHETDIIERFSKAPVFSLSDLSQIIRNRDYAKKVIARMVERKKVKRIRKNLYTFHDDPFLVSTFLMKPSYISSVSALSYHHMITQMPKEVFCFTSKLPKKCFFMERISFYHTKFFFGFEMQNYRGFDIPIATPEKALIDSIGKVPLSVVDEAFEDANIERMVLYLKKIKKSNTVKRIGYLLEKNGHEAFPALKKYINDKYIPLDPMIKRKGGKNRKWKIIL
ncbi:MAG: hypothetical protein KKB25_02310 [Nanoarchaeota archaeon]|nr:hypothetical protein [Nanoarchaeota archaeon]